jgi:hypothetical protein
MNSVTLSRAGVTADEAARIEQVLCAMDGVHAVAMADGQARVDYDPQRLDLGRIGAALVSVGFDVETPQEDACSGGCCGGCGGERAA